MFLAYEATDNHSGTPDFCMGETHRAMDHLGMWGWEVARRKLCLRPTPVWGVYSTIR